MGAGAYLLVASLVLASRTDRTAKTPDSTISRMHSAG
jgi:hypothetical protein